MNKVVDMLKDYGTEADAFQVNVDKFEGFLPVVPWVAVQSCWHLACVSQSVLVEILFLKLCCQALPSLGVVHAPVCLSYGTPELLHYYAPVCLVAAVKNNSDNQYYNNSVYFIYFLSHIPSTCLWSCLQLYMMVINILYS